MKRYFRSLGSRGDTIVEVMIAVAIIGSVLAAAFAVTNRNVRATQDTQEQAVAIKLVQQQIELLETFAFDPTTNRCFNIDGSGTQITTASNDCATITTGASGATYDISVTLNSANGVYTVSATWAGLNSSKNVTMYYVKASV